MENKERRGERMLPDFNILKEYDKKSTKKQRNTRLFNILIGLNLALGYMAYRFDWPFRLFSTPVQARAVGFVIFLGLLPAISLIESLIDDLRK